jgi:transposase
VFLWLRRGTLRSAQVVRFLRHLRRHQRGPVLLLWDGLNTHRSRETRAHLDAQRHWLEVHRLPPYAPELNPVESLWGWFKGPAGTAHLCPDSLEPLARELRQARRRLGRRSAVLDGFLHRTGLFFAA